MNNSLAAYRAGTSRRFRKMYGDNAQKVVRLLMRGETTEDIAVQTGVSKTSVAAFKANLTRGTYSQFVRNGHWRP